MYLLIPTKAEGNACARKIRIFTLYCKLHNDKIGFIVTQNSREFQVFVKPVGAACNLRCHYCYYLEKEDLYRTDFNKPHYSDNSGYQVNSDHPNIPDNHEKPGQRGKRTVKRHRMVRMSDDLLERYIICHINATTEPVINFSWHGGEPFIQHLLTIVKNLLKLPAYNQAVGNGTQKSQRRLV